MNEEAEHYNKQGLRLLSGGMHREALEFFSKAIELNPQHSEAYHNRGQLLIEMDRIIEGNADIRKSKDLRSGKIKRRKGSKGENKNGKRAKLNWQEIENIYDSVFPVDAEDEESEGLEAYDRPESGSFQGTTSEPEEVRGRIYQYKSNPPAHPAILQLLNGKHLEIARLRLFEPTDNDISIIREDGHIERVVPLQNITCIRQAELPSSFMPTSSSSSFPPAEQIETIDGNNYHVVVLPAQKNKNVLLCLCQDKKNDFVYTFIPKVNIRKRCQDRLLGEILQEKGLIGDKTLKNALNEYQQSKTLELGKIIAEKGKVSLAAIEEELAQANQTESYKGLKTGEILLASGIVKEDQILDALQHQDYLQKVKIGQYLIDQGIIAEKDVYEALADKFMIPFVDLSKLKVSRNTLTLLPKKLVIQNEILPISLDNNILTVATPVPDSAHLRQVILETCDIEDVRFVLSQPSHLKIIISQLSDTL